MNFKISHSLLLTIVVGVFAASCSSGGENTGYDYFPDMRDSRAFESYQMHEGLEDSMIARVPAAGSIPRGFQPFNYQNNIEDYERAGAALRNPYQPTENVLNEGKHFYDIYCAICHGQGGEGNGAIVQREKFPPPPSFFTNTLMELPVGKMFFSVHFGKGLMGSYASQLTKEERWKVITYIGELQRQNRMGSGEGDIKPSVPAPDAPGASTGEQIP